MSRFKTRWKQMMSFFTAFVLLFSTVASSVPSVVVNAADTVKSVNVNTLKAATVNGYGKFDLESDTSKYTVEVQSKMKKAVDSGPNKDWIWQDSDQGNDSSIKNLGNAYIHSLEPDTSYWIQYNNIHLQKDNGESQDTYDVRVVFDNAKGKISGADGYDIALFDGQLGAVRFRGYKSIDCSIYVYEHGTKNLVSGDAGKMHLRFVDIDCHQAVEVLSVGRVDWAYKRNKLSWMGEDKCKEIGAEYGNTVWYNGPTDVRDDWIQATNEDNKKTAARYTFTLGFTPSASADTTFKVRYYAGGSDAIGTQKNGAFFSFDGNLDLDVEDDPFFTGSVSKQVNGTTDAVLANAKESFTYTLNAVIDAGSTGGTQFTVTDTLDNVLQPTAITAITKDGADVSGNFDYSINGQTVTVSAKSSYLATNPTGTFSVNVATKIKDGANLAPYYDAARNYAVINNKCTLTTNDGGDAVSMDSNTVTVRVPLAELALDKVADAYEYKVGDTVTYTISVKNVTTNSTAYDVVMTDAIPSDLQVTGVTPSTGSGSVDGQNVRVTGANLGANQTLTVKVACKALESGNTKELYRR